MNHLQLQITTKEAQALTRSAMTFLDQKHYKEATAHFKSALKLSPKLKHGLEMLIVSETLYYGNIHLPEGGVDWYSVLHLHPSATETEVKLRFVMLISRTEVMESARFPGVYDAHGILHQAKAVLCDEGIRCDFDAKRRKSGLVDSCKSGRKVSFEDDYVNWVPPMLMGSHLEKKRARPMSMSVVDGEKGLFIDVKKVAHQVFDEMPQSPLSRLEKRPIPNAAVGLTPTPQSPEVKKLKLTLSPRVKKLNPPLSPEVKKLKPQMFEEMPKSPHLDLEKITRPNGTLAVISIPQSVVDEEKALSPQVKKIKPQLFDEMPKSPHSNLEKVTIPNASLVVIPTPQSVVNEEKALSPQVKKIKDHVFDEKPKCPHLHLGKRPRPEASLALKLTPQTALSPEVKKVKEQVFDEKSQSIGSHAEKKPRLDGSVALTSTPLSVVDAETALSPEVKKLKHQVFEEMPQFPHFAPLEKYTTRVRKGMMIGLDLAFINFCEDIRMLEHPQSIWSGFDDLMDQLKELEEMGYNVEKVKERLETLKRIADLDRALLDEVNKFEDEMKQHEAKIADMRSQILELEAEIEKSKAMIEKQGVKIDTMKKESMDAVEEFASTAKSTWK